MTIVEMRVHMDCPGCESKIRKALRKLDGVDNVDIDMSMQKVMVTGWIDQEKVLETVRKNGRHAELWPFPYNPEYHDFNQTYYNQFYRNPSAYITLNPETYFASETTFVTSAAAADDDDNDYNDDHFSSYNYNDDHGHFSSYNYNVHGYNGHDHGYYQEPPFTTIFSERASSMFSDENAHGCCIM